MRKTETLQNHFHSIYLNFRNNKVGHLSQAYTLQRFFEIAALTVSFIVSKLRVNWMKKPMM